jgi:RNA-binding protein
MPDTKNSKINKIHLRSQAHHLKPVVMIGQTGISPSVLQEIDVSLRSHHLMKIRILGENSEIKQAVIESVTQELKAQLIQSIGKILVFYREGDVVLDVNKSKYQHQQKPSINASPREVKIRKVTRSTRRNPLKILTVLGNQRVTAGGLVKRKKKRQVSKKKNFATTN